METQVSQGNTRRQEPRHSRPTTPSVPSDSEESHKGPLYQQQLSPQPQAMSPMFNRAHLALPAPPGRQAPRQQQQPHPQPQAQASYSAPQSHNRASLFPKDSLEFHAISRAYQDCTSFKQSLMSLVSICESLKTESIEKNKQLTELAQQNERDSEIMAEQNRRIEFLNEKLIRTVDILKVLKNENRVLQKENAFLKDKALDKDEFIKNSISIKTEHNVVQLPLLEEIAFPVALNDENLPVDESHESSEPIESPINDAFHEPKNDLVVEKTQPPKEHREVQMPTPPESTCNNGDTSSIPALAQPQIQPHTQTQTQTQTQPQLPSQSQGQRPGLVHSPCSLTQNQPVVTNQNDPDLGAMTEGSINAEANSRVDDQATTQNIAPVDLTACQPKITSTLIPASTKEPKRKPKNCKLIEIDSVSLPCIRRILPEVRKDNLFLINTLIHHFNGQLASLQRGIAFESFSEAEVLLTLHHANVNGHFLLEKSTTKRRTDNKEMFEITTKLKCSHCNEDVYVLVLDSQIDEFVRLSSFTHDHTCDLNKVNKVINFRNRHRIWSELTKAYHDLGKDTSLFMLYLTLRFETIKNTKETAVYLTSKIVKQFKYLARKGTPPTGNAYLEWLRLTVSGYYLKKSGVLEEEKIKKINRLLKSNYEGLKYSTRYIRRLEDLTNAIVTEEEKNKLSFTGKLISLEATLMSLVAHGALFAVFSGSEVLSSFSEPHVADLIKRDVRDARIDHSEAFDNLTDINKFSKNEKLNNLSIKNLGVLEDELRGEEDIAQRCSHEEWSPTKQKVTVDKSTNRIEEEFWKEEKVRVEKISADELIKVNGPAWRKFDADSIDAIFFQHDLPVKFIAEKSVRYLEVDQIEIESKEGFNHLLMVTIRLASSVAIPLSFCLCAENDRETWLNFLVTFYHYNRVLLSRMNKYHIVTTSDRGVKSAVTLAFKNDNFVIHTSVHHLVKDIKKFTLACDHEKVERCVSTMVLSTFSAKVDEAKSELLDLFIPPYNNILNYAYATVMSFTSTFSREGLYTELGVFSIHSSKEYKEFLDLMDNPTNIDMIINLAQLQSFKLANAQRDYLQPETESDEYKLVQFGNIAYTLTMTLSQFLTAVPSEANDTFMVSVKPDIEVSEEDFYQIVKNLYQDFEIEPEFFNDHKIRFQEFLHSSFKVRWENGRASCTKCIDSEEERYTWCPHEIAVFMKQNNLVLTKPVDHHKILKNTLLFKYHVNNRFFVSNRLIKDLPPDTPLEVLPPYRALMDSILRMQNKLDAVKKTHSSEEQNFRSVKRAKLPEC